MKFFITASKQFFRTLLSCDTLSTLENGFAEIGGGKIYYEITGDPKDFPVVLIHAGFLDRRMWDEQFNSFAAEGFRVIRYDMRGLGKSDKPQSKYDNAADLMELLDRVGWNEKSCIIGVSNGGSAAIDFAIEYPTRVKCLVLVAPTVNGYEFSDIHEEKLWKTIDKESQDQERAVKENRFEDAVKIQLDIVASALSKEAREKMFKVAIDNCYVFVHPLSEMQRQKNPPAFKRLSEISVPTLLLWGDRDFPGQISLAERVHSLIPQSKRTLIHGADHLVNVSQPELFNRVVLNFLRSQKNQ